MLDTLHDNHRCCHITQTPELISWSANVLSLYGLPLYLHIVYMNLYNYTTYILLQANAENLNLENRVIKDIRLKRSIKLVIYISVISFSEPGS